MGFTKKKLTTPLKGKWRADLIGVAPGPRTINLVEVKGSVADLTRESLVDGKWVVDFESYGVTPWLAITDEIRQKHVDLLPRQWGIVSFAEGARPKIMRTPLMTVLASDARLASALAATSSVLTLQSLPKIMGLNQAERAWAMNETISRPWQEWDPRNEEPGNIL